VLNELDRLDKEFQSQLASAATSEALERVRVEFLGRKGRLAELMKTLPALSPAERPAAGKRANEVKCALVAALDERAKALASKAPARRAAEDLTLPGIPVRLGRRHVIMQTMVEMVDIFQRLGFDVAWGPEVEDTWHNFEALNIPLDHPAADPDNSFFLSDRVILRTQTSPVQIRVMETQKPPIRVVAPGRVYRPETVDASHGYMFHQLEGLMVDEGVTFRDLKCVLNLYVREFFSPGAKTRFRPHFFPFTEPSAELDMACTLCDGKGCAVCGGKGWLELLGCGMVDPNVLAGVGIDPERYTGFAFGFGIERPAMLKHGIHDIRLLFENDVRFLEQF
jgi:phenylalanyl-tRNA synthetase alpha chain